MGRAGLDGNKVVCSDLTNLCRNVLAVDSPGALRPAPTGGTPDSVANSLGVLIVFAAFAFVIVSIRGGGFSRALDCRRERRVVLIGQED